MRKRGFLRTFIGILLLILFAELVYLKFIKDPVRVSDGAPSSAQTQTAPVPQESAAPQVVEPSPSAQVSEQPTPVDADDPASGTDIPDEKAGLPDVDITSWELLLVNTENNIGEYTPDVTELEGQNLDSRIIEPMKAFVAAARAEGLSVYLSSGYRDYATQLYLYNRKVSQVGDPDYAATIVARPGTSEHQTGLACDITDQYYDPKTQDLENTALFQWMSKHCQEYGFIVRYPKGSEEVTGIMYEPWHFRYVGIEAAQYIMEHGITLEEFVELYK